MDAFWDRRAIKFWGIALIVLFFWPVGCTPKTQFAWDVIGEAEEVTRFTTLTKNDIIFNMLLPHLVGVAALVALVFDRASKVRGAIYVVAAALCLFLAFRIVFGTLFAGFGGVTGGFMERMVLVIAMGIVGPALVVAGNRVQKREDGATLPRLFAGIGGLAILAAFLLPLEPMGESFMLIEIFGQGEVWKHGWYFMIWLLAFFLYGLFGALLLIPGGDPERRGSTISILARILPIGLMLVILVAALDGGGRRTGEVVSQMIRNIGTLFGVVLVLAIGLALLMESPKPEQIDHEKAF